MKILLIAINLILSGLVLYSGMALLRTNGASGFELKTGKDRKAKTTKERLPVEKKDTGAPLLVLRDPGEAGRIVVAKNIFDPQRCPNAVGGRGARSGGTLSLVGIYRVGDIQGAIILTKNGSRTAAAANPGRTAVRTTSGPTRTGVQSVAQSNIPNQCYFRLGEILPNGYTLSQIDPTQVTLTRGSSKMVLPLALASENASSGTPAQTRTNPLQQMLQLMQRSVDMQQMQQMNMMRMMRTQPQNNAGSTPTRSTNTRGRSTQSR
ncbi:hypothetical protein SDC9_74486 [bioreactor metagenome]|uniref:Uncharacterized protein n=1 Tax=bioreactor metagenome TaxID=1076179 RepID=A0A644YI14_9ZZZZ